MPLNPFYADNLAGAITVISALYRATLFYLSAKIMEESVRRVPVLIAVVILSGYFAIIPFLKNWCHLLMFLQR